MTDAVAEAIAELESTGETVAKLKAALRQARVAQRVAINKAASAGLSEVAIAQHAGVTRMTVRADLGK
ncbi:MULTISPECIES: hypothetical protein [unclassified Microbacterium]|uniref:hypothetical protein n=1 Tax=unclassified Microbacterium TaxID=2609290 RepID=UPI00301A377C